jgi:hypothetical protein
MPRTLEYPNTPLVAHRAKRVFPPTCYRCGKVIDPKTDERVVIHIKGSRNKHQVAYHLACFPTDSQPKNVLK